MMVRKLHENLFLSSLLLVVTAFYKTSLVTALSSFPNAFPDDLASEQQQEQKEQDNQRRRSLLLRGGGESDEAARQLGSKSGRDFHWSHLEEYGERLQMYQMDTSSANPGRDSEDLVDQMDRDSSEDFMVDAVTQPFSQPLANGATGELIYRDFGWEFLYTFVGTRLPSGQSYELIYFPNSPDPAADIVCFGSSTVGNFGQLTIFGNIPNLPSLPKPSDANRDVGAKLWLVPSTDIDCGGALQVQTMAAAETRNYPRYLFSGRNEFLKYDYLGD